MLSREQLVELYVNQELNSGEVAAVLGREKKSVLYWLKKYGLTRSKSDALRLQWKRGLKHKPIKGNYASGPRSGRWKGGRLKDAQGYIRVLSPDHPRAQMGPYGKRRYVMEHILVWEKANGRLLPDGWIVHHLNGVKDDNRPENLVALPSQQHVLYLREQSRRIRELEIQVKELKGALAGKKPLV